MEMKSDKKADYIKKNMVIKMELIFESATVSEDVLYYFCRDLNLLCCYNLVTKKGMILGSIPEEDPFEPDLCGGIKKWKNYLILVPRQAKKIWIFNIKDYTWEGIGLPEGEGKYKYFDSKLINNFVLIIGYWQNNIIILDLITKEIKVIYEFQQGQKLGYSSALIDKVLYVVDSSLPRFFEISLQHCTCKIVDIDICSEGFYGIDYDGKYFWIITQKSSILKVERCKSTEYNFEMISEGKEAYYPRGIASIQDCIIGGSVVRKGSKIIANGYDYIEENEIWFLDKCENKVFYATQNGSLFFWNSTLKKFQKFQVTANKIDICNWLLKAKNNTKYTKFKENEIANLSFFLNLVEKGRKE